VKSTDRERKLPRDPNAPGAEPKVELDGVARRPVELAVDVLREPLLNSVALQGLIPGHQGHRGPQPLLV